MTINFTTIEIQEIIRLHLMNKYNILHSVVTPNFNPNDMKVPIFNITVVTKEEDEKNVLAEEVRKKFNLATNYIDAIKHVRTVTNCGLKEGKDFVDAIRDGKM